MSERTALDFLVGDNVRWHNNDPEADGREELADLRAARDERDHLRFRTHDGRTCLLDAIVTSGSALVPDDERGVDEYSVACRCIGELTAERDTLRARVAELRAKAELWDRLRAAWSAVEGQEPSDENWRRMERTLCGCLMDDGAKV